MAEASADRASLTRQAVSKADGGAIWRIDLPETPAAVSERSSVERDRCESEVSTTGHDEDLQRRESVLNARIAQFETLVRKTKLSMSEKMDKMREREEFLTERLERFERYEEELSRREEETTRRESVLKDRLVQYARKEEELLARAEELVEREREIEGASEAFENRSASVLRQIRDQKEELEQLLARLR